MEHLKYRPDIDGLRAVAVLSVVIFHYFPSILPGGFVGVDIFFVISGYLITSIILKSASSNSFSYVEFYKRRILRIFPALSIVLISCIIIGWV
ncbi:acyltransferase, partial [Salmonella enterica]|nr:acyltransferase [Salmonella enterica]